MNHKILELAHTQTEKEEKRYLKNDGAHYSFSCCVFDRNNQNDSIYYHIVF